MKKLGKELEFVSWINRDGSGTIMPPPEKMIRCLDEEKFKLYRLSITYDTYIIHGFNSFVVKIKNNTFTTPSSEANKVHNTGDK